MVRRFILQCLVLALPVLLFFAFVAWVDPYDLFGHGGPVPRTLKIKNLDHSGRTVSFSNMMWKLIEFRRAPRAHILLGDSRLSHFDLDLLHEHSGDRYYNLGIQGGNFKTVHDLFTYADNLVHLEKVYVQVSFRNMDHSKDADIYTEPRAALDAPYRYVTNRRVIDAAVLNLFSRYFPNAVSYVTVTPEQWRVKLDAERTTTAQFEIDTTVYANLQAIADRCKAGGAELIFLEYPSHPELQRIYTDAGLTPARDAYIERLRRIAPTIDIDASGTFPSDRPYWRDPLHLSPLGQQRLIDHVWASER